MNTFLVSLTSIVVALLAAWATAVLAEDYRRFRDGTSLAAALAGELQAYIEAFERGTPILQNIRNELAKGLPLTYIPPFKSPGDPVYESGVAHLGLLGPEIARDVTYTYQLLNAFRAGFVTLTETYSKVTPSIVLGSFDSSLELLEKAEERGKKALAQLDRRARMSYWLFPWPRNRSAVGKT